MEPRAVDGRVEDVQPAVTMAAASVAAKAAVSFEGFCARHRDPVGRALALALGDADLAADAVDEAMIRAYQRWDRVGGLDNPGGWVYRVGMNHARSRLRRRRGREELLHATGSVVDEMADADLAAALGALPLDQRSAIVCRYYLGWSEAETVTALRVRPGTVKSRVHRGLRALRRTLERGEEHG